MLESRKKETERRNEEVCSWNMYNKNCLATSMVMFFVVFVYQLQQQLKGDTIVELQKRCQSLQEEVNRYEQQKQQPINSNGVSTAEKACGYIN